jgi:hypothetical protein
MFTLAQEPITGLDTDTPTEAVAETYLQFAQGPTFSMDVEPESAQGRAIFSLCTRPEFRPLVEGIRFQICDEPGVPFRTLDGDTVQLDRKILDQPPAAAYHFRHALELAALFRAAPGLENSKIRLACAILGFYTAFAYLQTLHQNESVMPLQHCQAWMRSAFVVISIENMINSSALDTAHAISRYWEHLLPLQGIDPHKIKARANFEDLLNCACKLAAGTLPLALPAERLLTAGGDNRLLIDPQTGLNQYGCSPRPRPWAITFSSCTASSISDIGYQETERLRQSLLSSVAGNSLSDHFIGETERIRREVATTLKLDRLPGTEVILTSSGTDGELYALYFALAGHGNGLLNILTAPNEIGSGSLPAAQGLYFDALTPLGGNVAPGTPIEGLQSGRVRVEPLNVRRESGEIVPSQEIDLKVVALVSQAVHKGDTVLIHLLDRSKTGLSAPDLETVRRLKEVYGDSVWGVVDAAQMRLDTDRLNNYLEQGFLVLITGSKFFTGAPFSGALVVPPAIARQVDRLPPFPAGFAEFATRYDFPPRWSYLASKLPDYPNIGLLLRWQSALWEMKSFYFTPRQERYRTIQSFGRAVLDMIDKNPDLELIAPPHRNTPKNIEKARWDRLPNIFTFFLLKRNHKGNTSSPLTYEEARQAYRWLNMDIAPYLPSNVKAPQRRLAAKRCHIAQPVRINRKNGQWLAALRMAVGARLVSGVYFDSALGATPRERLATEIRDAGVVLEKLSLIARHWDQFCRIDQDDFLETGLQPRGRHEHQLNAVKTTGKNPD